MIKLIRLIKRNRNRISMFLYLTIPGNIIPFLFFQMYPNWIFYAFLLNCMLAVSHMFLVTSVTGTREMADDNSFS